MNSALSRLKDEEKNSNFVKRMRNSFERKIDAVWAREYAKKLETNPKNEDIQTSNSKWHEVAELAKQKIGGRSTNGYSMAISILATKDKLNHNVEAENKIADLYIDYL